MKKVLIAAAFATAFVAPHTFAQSAFEGFYGQIATGYENNQLSSLNATGISQGNPNENWNTSNQSFGNAPLVLGLGYNFSVAPQWLVGIGADYSAISLKSSTYDMVGTGVNAGSSVTGNQLQTSNRFNIFVTPGYAIDKDKLVYLKAGYSSVSLKTTGITGCNPSSNCTGGVNFSNPSNTLSGYVLGLGYKQIITGGFYGFAEANYMSYSKTSFNSVNQKAGSDYTFSTNPSLSSYQALVGVGYKF